MSFAEQDMSKGTMIGSRPVPGVDADLQAKYRAQQQYAMNSSLNGQERQARLQVLGIATAIIAADPSLDTVAVAEKLWSFVTAGDAPTGELLA